MRKYWALYKAGVSMMFVFRGSMFLWIFGNILNVVCASAVWLSLSSNGLVGGYSKDQLITYSVVSVFLAWIITWNPFSAVKREIKDGTISGKILVKPISYYLERLVWELAWHSVSVFIGIGVGLVAVLMFKDHLTVSIFSSAFFVSIPALLLAGFLQYNFSMLLALLAFWFSEVEPINSVKWMALAILGGTAIPIGFIPQWFQSTIKLLPFRYMFSFPVEIMMGKTEGLEVIIGYMIGSFWVLAMIILYKILWSKGLKVYTAVGN